MNRAAVLMLVIFYGACGSPSNNQPDGGGASPDASTPDGTTTPPDAPLPVLGTTCPSKLTEATRMTAAADSAYSVFSVLVGKFDNNPSDDVVLVEDQFDSANSRTLLRFKLFANNGTTFTAPVVSNATFPEYGPEQVLVGDFNGDHLLDIAISYTDSEEDSRVSYVYVATQQADHTFVLGPAINLSSCKSSSDERYFALGVLDVDRDGKDDLLATISYDGLGALPAGLSWLKGTASGLGGATCANTILPQQMITASRFRVADFDGDGQLDVAGFTDTGMALFHNTGPSSFGAAISATTYNSSMHLAADPGHGVIGLDVQTTGATATRFQATATGLVAHPIGTFSTEGAPLGNYDAIRGFAVGDFNGDGFTDVIAVGNHDYSDNNPGPVSFGIACDRSAHWDVIGGGFPDGIYKLDPIGFGGRTDVVVQDGLDLVVYKIDP